ncbi:nuclear factor related to kappa-B-binding protein isoform X3 [Dendroctonus ponderosae]|uniref:nuclear factor related to kappa-B-binding protein isoform X3 n=1 Tax=Dendroctonus ponderosae TaxID=77166 RepID=UPI002035C91C|nr:nuclear factor related to kappa-B-binding protein isoform X3 [Dendroctonus ponderosae]
MTTSSESEGTGSSDYTDSSDEDGMETAYACGTKIQVPQGLCERKDIFDEFFTVDLWNSFSDEDKEHLQTFLPNFPENDDLEKTKTLQRLFDFENFRFSNPLTKFYDHLKAGYFRPEIARMRKMIHKKERLEAKFRQQKYKKQLKRDVIESQRKLMNQMKFLPPGHEPKQEKRKLDLDQEYVYCRTKKKYFQVLAAINGKMDDADFSPDENYPEGPCTKLPKKQKRHLNSIRNSLNTCKGKLYHSTMVGKANGISIDLEKYVTTYQNPFYITDESYKNVLHQHRKRKSENCGDPELDVDGISIIDVINRTQLPFIKNLQIKPNSADIKPVLPRKRIKKELDIRKSCDSNVFTDAVTVPTTSASFSSVFGDNKFNSLVKAPLSPKKIKDEIKAEILDPIECFETIPSSIQGLKSHILRETASPITTVLQSNYGEITPIKMEDLETIDIMNTPIELDNSEIDIMELSIKPELMQDTHANFFSLIRDVICSTIEHRMNMYTLQERLKAWQENPISPLNDWYSYVDNWINILPSAITFLCGNASEQPDDFVPYMEYKLNLDVYQWIGAGRDSDPLLSNLCNFWLQHRTESKMMKPLEVELDIADKDGTPPPPRCPTTWTVRKATLEDIKDYREQERRRYDNPHKAFTFRCNGYESVVGPLKGIYYPAPANSKARGHTMLNADRPNFVTILSLVRDATARLPNGEGTRSEICELLKSSQYISSSAPDSILQSVVSGALDRMHTQWDPCVKYDQKKKTWVYLHRHRTEDDFERIHQHYQGVQKGKKTARKSPAKPKTPKGEKVTKTTKILHPKAVIVGNNVNTANSNVVTQHVIVSTNDTRKEHNVHVEEAKEEVVDGQRSQDLTEVKSADKNTSVPPEIITVSMPQQKTTTIRRPGVFQAKTTGCKDEKLLVVTTTPNLIAASQKGTSLLLSNNLPKQQETSQPSPTRIKAQSLVTKRESLEEETPELMHIRVASPMGVIKGAAKGSMVKIMSPSQGKSVIIPTSNPQILKQIQERPTKAQVTQQFLQSLAIQAKQKTVTTKGTIELPEGDSVKHMEKAKIPVNIQQQIVQGLTTQQLQNIKNVTLLRTNNPTVTMNSQSNIESQDGIHVSGKIQTQTETVQLKTSANLTTAQTQQILQTIKQKYLPNANMLTPQQQVLLKQKGCVVQLQKSTGVVKNSASGSDNMTKTIQSGQVPMVAKVLTNAAGQVISVESLLAHQKAHGALPHGTTLRVQGSKAGQQNVIHLTSAAKPNTIAHFTVGSQNNLVALTTQPKLVVAPQTTTVTTTVTQSKPQSTSYLYCRNVASSRIQPGGKTQNLTQHLVNAKIITSDGQKIVQPKMMVGGQAIKVPSKVGARTANFGSSLRMLNTANLNLTTLDGKPVLLASKSGIQSLHGQNVIVQAHPGSTPTSSSLVLQSAVTKKAGHAISQSQGSTNMLGQSGNIVFSSTAIKNQVPQQVLFSSQGKSGSVSATTSQAGHIVLGNQPIRLQTNSASGSQRVVLASQGQGGQILAQQILLPAGFQGAAINIKSLQGVKVIPIAQNQKGQSRQIVAKVMNPSVVKQATQQSTPVQLQESVTIHSSESE